MKNSIYKWRYVRSFSLLIILTNASFSLYGSVSAEGDSVKASSVIKELLIDEESLEDTQNEVSKLNMNFSSRAHEELDGLIYGTNTIKNLDFMESPFERVYFQVINVNGEKYGLRHVHIVIHDQEKYSKETISLKDAMKLFSVKRIKGFNDLNSYFRKEVKGLGVLRIEMDPLLSYPIEERITYKILPLNL